MRDDVRLIDAYDLHGRVMGDLTNEFLARHPTYTMDDIRPALALMADDFMMCWAELVQWAKFGDDMAAKTRDIVRASLLAAPMYGRGSIWN